MTNANAEEMAATINGCLPHVKVGTLRFWGEWFGRPYDNVHRLVECSTERDVLILRFNEGESLTLWAPRELTADERTFRIADAERIRWEWFSYGRPKVAQNRFYMEFTKEGSAVTVATDFHPPKEGFRPSVKHAAVEIL